MLNNIPPAFQKEKDIRIPKLNKKRDAKLTLRVDPKIENIQVDGDLAIEFVNESLKSIKCTGAVVWTHDKNETLPIVMIAESFRSMSMKFMEASRSLVKHGYSINGMDRVDNPPKDWDVSNYI